MRERLGLAIDRRPADSRRRMDAGFGYEFLERADGYPGLIRTYGLAFGGAPRAMDLSLIYKALADGQVDVIAGDATSAQIDALDLTRSTTASITSRPTMRCRRPDGRAAAPRGDWTGDGAVGGRVSERDMRAMNRAVDVDRRDPRDVAAEFLTRLNNMKKSHVAQPR